MKRLCDPKVRVLMKEVAKKPIFGEQEKIRANAKFTSQQIRQVLIPVKVVKKKTVEPTAEEVKQASLI